MRAPRFGAVPKPVLAGARYGSVDAIEKNVPIDALPGVPWATAACDKAARVRRRGPAGRLRRDIWHPASASLNVRANFGAPRGAVDADSGDARA